MEEKKKPPENWVGHIERDVDWMKTNIADHAHYKARIMDIIERVDARLKELEKYVNPDNGRRLTCGLCGETALQICTHIADAREERAQEICDLREMLKAALRGDPSFSEDAYAYLASVERAEGVWKK